MEPHANVLNGQQRLDAPLTILSPLAAVLAAWTAALVLLSLT